MRSASSALGLLLFVLHTTHTAAFTLSPSIPCSSSSAATLRTCWPIANEADTPAPAPAEDGEEGAIAPADVEESAPPLSAIARMRLQTEGGGSASDDGSTKFSDPANFLPTSPDFLAIFGSIGGVAALGFALSAAKDAGLWGT